MNFKGCSWGYSCRQWGGQRGYERCWMSQKQWRSKTSPSGSCGCVHLIWWPTSHVFSWLNSPSLNMQWPKVAPVLWSAKGLWERLGSWMLSAQQAGRAMMFMVLFEASSVLWRWEDVQNSCLLCQPAAWGDGRWGKTDEKVFTGLTTEISLMENLISRTLLSLRFSVS